MISKLKNMFNRPARREWIKYIPSFIVRYLLEKEEKKLDIRTFIKYPVHYDSYGQMIFDANGDHLLDIRGWGRLQKLSNGDEKQDEIGRFIAKAINNEIKKKNNIY